MLNRLLLLSLAGVAAGCGAQNEAASRTLDANGPLVVETSTRPDRLMSVLVTKDALVGHANVEAYIGKSLSSLPSKGEAQAYLSNFATKNAYKKPGTDGVNCWFTAIASVMPSFSSARFMTDKEFACHLNTSFTKTTAPKFGDVIRLHKANGEEVHGATYVGQDASGKVIAFTKNGTTKETAWTFMTLDTLKNSVYDETESITYYTPKSAAKDPTSAGMPCFEEAEASRFETKRFEGSGGSGTPLGDLIDL